MKIHRRVVYPGNIPLPSKARCGSPGKRTSKDDEVTCEACQRLMKRDETLAHINVDPGASGEVKAAVVVMVEHVHEQMPLPPPPSRGGGET